MNKIALSVAIVFSMAVTAVAQPPAGRQGPPGGPPGGFRGPPGFHLMTALDADRDGKISTKEIENAVAALRKLDKNKDGKLSADEIGWPPAGGFGRGGGRGGFPGPGGPPGGERSKRPDVDSQGSGATRKQPSGNGSGESRFFSVEQLKSLDRNKDGKIVKDEIPKGLQELILGRVDTNKDGVIDQGELAKVGKPRERK